MRQRAHRVGKLVVVPHAMQAGGAPVVDGASGRLITGEFWGGLCLLPPDRWRVPKAERLPTLRAFTIGWIGAPCPDPNRWRPRFVVAAVRRSLGVQPLADWEIQQFNRDGH